jgi:hypothetical protein
MYATARLILLWQVGLTIGEAEQMRLLSWLCVPILSSSLSQQTFTGAFSQVLTCSIIAHLASSVILSRGKVRTASADTGEKQTKVCALTQDL